MKFQLSYNNFAERLVFPVNPPGYEITGGGTGFNDFTRISGGEATVIGDDALAEVSFSSFFPRDYDPSLCEYRGIPKPWDAVRTIERWRRSKWPVRLIISGTPINMACTIREFPHDERGGEPGDIYFSIKLHEYPFIKIREMTDAAESGGALVPEPKSGRPDLQQIPSTYTVVAGDTLWGIAKRMYGNGAEYKKLHAANETLIGPDPNVLRVGQTLEIP